MLYNLYTDLPEFAGDICDEIRLFVSVRRIENLDQPNAESEGYCFIHRFKEEDDVWQNSFEMYFNGNRLAYEKKTTDKQDKNDTLIYKKLLKRAVKNTAFCALNRYFKTDPPWGSLTGIRPTKLMRELQNNLGKDEAKRMFKEEFFVSDKKILLADNIVEIQNKMMQNVNQNYIDIYIGIPFCISKCAYCSFASATISKKGEIESKYVDALLREINLCKDLFCGKTIRNIYIGGGTPTALSEELFEKIIEAVACDCLEFTVEAGRPDTITKEKLDILKRFGVNRISVNAQTMCDDTLKLIGRNHTADEFRKAFELVRKYDFNIVNTDIIIGLPNENMEIAKKSISEIISLNPENITVHSLAIKRSSAFAGDIDFKLSDAAEASEMLEMCADYLNKGGYSPYYMYRQKYMTGNLENTGYALKGKESIYNVDIMEECMDILAFGAGAISKRIYRDENRIERAPNVKDILHYVNRVEEMVDRKKKLFNQ